MTGQQAAARIRATLTRFIGGYRRGLSTGTGDDPCPNRTRLIETPWFAVFVHHIRRPDVDPHPHDHPWTIFWSWVICGGYTERVWPDKRNPDRWYQRNRSRWSLARMPRDAAHIITAISKPLWTVVVTGRSYGAEYWDFWVPVNAPVRRARDVQWRLYISGNGTAEDAPPPGAG